MCKFVLVKCGLKKPLSKANTGLYSCQCLVCFSYTDLLSGTNGLKKPSAEKRHNCDECDFTTARPRSLKLHKAFKHSNGRLTSFLFYYYYFLNYKFSLLFYIGFK